MLINDPATIAEVETAFAAYEAALMANDVAMLDTLFWDSPFTIRIGPGQNLYGIEAIRAFRLGRIGGSPPRTIFNTKIVSYGTDCATAHTEFQRAGGAPPGRQTQSWVRMPEGWRVVCAHVSMLGEGN